MRGPVSRALSLSASTAKSAAPSTWSGKEVPDAATSLTNRDLAFACAFSISDLSNT